MRRGLQQGLNPSFYGLPEEGRPFRVASILTRPFGASFGDLLSQSRYDAVPKRGDLRRDNKRAESRGRSQLTVTVKPESQQGLNPLSPSRRSDRDRGP